MSAVTDPDRPDLGGNLRHGDSHTHCPQLWNYLIERFAVRSILDVGCGEGHAVHWFNTQGVYCVGIDGLSLNIINAVHPIIRHDIREFPGFLMPVDLVWSCEVAEHIDERYVTEYVDTLCNGRIIVMTHAVPGQGGYHHVNEQPAGYWIDKVTARGYRLHDATDIGRHIDEGWSTYFNSSGLVFVRL